MNVTDVSDTVAEVIVQARERPISIGVWSVGVGKSPMVNLVRTSLEPRQIPGVRDAASEALLR